MDTASVIFKAKLLTLSEYGLTDKKQLIEDIEGQNAKILKSVYDGFIFVKVDFNQPFRAGEGVTKMMIRNCSYYLAFNTYNYEFYKLGGSNEIDIDRFMPVLLINEAPIFRDFENGNEIEGIDIFCLHEYYELKKKKRLKKGYHCLENCAEETIMNVADFNK